MGMASRELGPGRLGLRAMLSAEPWTIGRSGYPLLLQTGETANGVDAAGRPPAPARPLHGARRHLQRPSGERRLGFVYLGLPGEPRWARPPSCTASRAMENPEAPLGHHWLDSTHITYGVATLGWIRGGVKLEGSVFTGREPDENRDEHREPQDGLLVRAGLLEPGARLVAPGQPRTSEEPRATGAGDRRRPHHGVGGVQPPARPPATGRPPSPGGGTPAIPAGHGRLAAGIGGDTAAGIPCSAASSGRRTTSCWGTGRTERRSSRSARSRSATSTTRASGPAGGPGPAGQRGPGAGRAGGRLRQPAVLVDGVPEGEDLKTERRGRRCPGGPLV